MPIGRRRADSGEARGLGEGEAGRTLLGDQLQRGADQRLAQIAVMIAARFIALAGLVLAPTHVKDAYMRAADKSMLAISPRPDGKRAVTLILGRASGSRLGLQ